MALNVHGLFLWSIYYQFVQMKPLLLKTLNQFIFQNSFDLVEHIRKFHVYQYVEVRGRGYFPSPEPMLRSKYTEQVVLSPDENAKSYTDDTNDCLYDFI